MRKFAKFNEKLRWDNNFWIKPNSEYGQTPLFMNIINTKSIAKIGSKEVNINTHGQERIHVTEILWILADGTKFS